MKSTWLRFRGWFFAGVVGVCTLAVLVALGVISLPGLGVSKAVSPAAVRRVEAQPVAVTVAPVTPRVVRRSVLIVGTFLGQEEVTITPKVEGRVVRLHHDTGDRVKPGDVLLEIDDTDYRLAVTEAQRALELELAKIGLTRLPDNKVEWGQIPTVMRAQSVEDNARLKFERAQRLRGTGAVAQEDRDQLASDHLVAKAAREQAVMEAQATLAAARHRQAVLETAKQRLADTQVVVPRPSPERLEAPHGSTAITPPSQPGPSVEFVVAQRMVSEGEMVRVFPSVTAFRLVMDRTLKLMAPVPERHVSEVHVGQSVAVAVEAYPSEVFHGTVARVNPTVDRANRTFLIEIHVPNEARKLKAGSFARAAVFTREDTQAPTVPEEALVRFAGVLKVFVVRDGKAHAVPVEQATRLEVATKGRTTHWIEVRGEVPAGSLVVTTGHSQLAEGTPVRIRE